MEELRNIKDETVISAISEHTLFYENYIHFYLNILPQLMDINVKCIKISKQFDELLHIKDKLGDVLNQQNISRKLIEIEENCASALLLHKDKFLILHSPTHNQFCLPQGHIEIGETSIQAASREVMEETGFTDFKITKPIRTYGYRFYKKGKIIRKIIVCFLGELNSLKNITKQLESHESYTNHFFTYEEAVMKLDWPEDIETMRTAYKILKAE